MQHQNNNAGVYMLLIYPVTDRGRSSEDKTERNALIIKLDVALPLNHSAVTFGRLWLCPQDCISAGRS